MTPLRRRRLAKIASAIVGLAAVATVARPVIHVARTAARERAPRTSPQ